MLRRAVSQKFTDVSEVLIAIRAMIVSSSETSINFYETIRCNIPEDTFRTIIIKIMSEQLPGYLGQV
jgi:hypothetical protein